MDLDNNQGRRERGTRGACQPPEIPMLKKIGVLVTILLQFISMSSPLGAYPQTLLGALPLDPAQGLPTPRPQFCPPPKQISGYASDNDVGNMTHSTRARRIGRNSGPGFRRYGLITSAIKLAIKLTIKLKT